MGIMVTMVSMQWTMTSGQPGVGQGSGVKDTGDTRRGNHSRGDGTLMTDETDEVIMSRPGIDVGQPHTG